MSTLSLESQPIYLDYNATTPLDRAALSAHKIYGPTGSACDSASGDSDYVLKAIGAEQDTITGAVRFSLGRFTRLDDIETAIAAIIKAVEQMRNNV